MAAIGDLDAALLVGHSFGGFTFSAVAEAAPDRIPKLIDDAAHVPATGKSLESLSPTDEGTRFSGENVVLAADHACGPAGSGTPYRRRSGALALFV